VNWHLLINSIVMAVATTVLAGGFGFVAALWLAGSKPRWQTVGLVFAIIALALPPFLVTNCWLDLFGETGRWRAWLPFNIFTLGGSIWILSLLLWPITALLALSGWKRLQVAQLESDPALTGFALIRELLVPIVWSELRLALLVTFVLALNNFAVPAILQIRVLPDEMWIRFNTALDAWGALKAGLPLILAPVLLIFLSRGREIGWPRLQSTVTANVLRRQLGGTWFLGCGLVGLLLCGLSVGVPVANIGLARRTWMELPGAIEAGAGATTNSFWLAAFAATVVVIVALLFSTRSSQRSRDRSVAGFLAWLPFFFPGVLLGIALIFLFNRPPFLAFYRSAGIVLLAFTIRYFALGLTGARQALRSTDPDLTDAARIEGASYWQLFRFVLWPQIAPQILAAWYVVYLLCLWDVESLVLVYPPGGETLAVRIFNLLHYGHAAQVNALCLTLLGLAILPLAVWGIWKSLSKLTAIRVPALMPAGMAVLLLCGCSESDEARVGRIESRLFERAEVIGSRGVGIGEFNKPRSVAVDLQDNVYSVDMTGRVQKFSPEGKYELSWQMPQTEKGKPKGMGRDREGNVVVVEPHYQRVNHFTPEGKLVAQWGCKGTNEGCFNLPRAIAVNSHGEFYVSEYMGAERVQKFSVQSSNQAVLVGVIGKAGIEPGEFNRAEGICVDSQDRLYVADSCNHRIEVFDREGKFLRAFGKPGSGLGELSYPYDVTVDAKGLVFVCEFGNSRIQVFDANYHPVEVIGGPGAEPGRFANPWGVALDSRGNLYVADALNHRVQKLVRRASAIAQTHLEGSRK
jgi:ABC-type Fe3+ transport system permease subunit/DNA-binding beta-propeller fold protein YncE